MWKCLKHLLIQARRMTTLCTDKCSIICLHVLLALTARTNGIGQKHLSDLLESLVLPMHHCLNHKQRPRRTASTPHCRTVGGTAMQFSGTLPHAADPARFCSQQYIKLGIDCGPRLGYPSTRKGPGSGRGSTEMADFHQALLEAIKLWINFSDVDYSTCSILRF